MRLPGIGPATALAFAQGERPVGDVDAEALKRGFESAISQISDYGKALARTFAERPGQRSLTEAADIARREG